MVPIVPATKSMVFIKKMFKDCDMHLKSSYRGLWMAEGVGLELTRPVRVDGLASRCTTIMLTFQWAVCTPYPPWSYNLRVVGYPLSEI